MRSLSILLSAIAATSGAFVTSSQAAPLSDMNSAIAAGSGLTKKAHFWHLDCEWGPVRYHRHIPGIGNVRCDRDRYGHDWDDDDDDDHEYRYRRKKRDWHDDDDY